MMMIVHVSSSHQEADAKQKLQEDEQMALLESFILARSRDFFEGDDVSTLLICHTLPRAYAHFPALEVSILSSARVLGMCVQMVGRN